MISTMLGNSHNGIGGGIAEEQEPAPLPPVQVETQEHGPSILGAELQGTAAAAGGVHQAGTAESPSSSDVAVEPTRRSGRGKGIDEFIALLYHEGPF